MREMERFSAGILRPPVICSSSSMESPASKRIREHPSSVTTAEPSTTTDQQAVPADAGSTTPTSVEMADNEQPEADADTRTTERQQTPVMAVVDPAQIHEAESITMVTDSIAVVTATDEDASQLLPQQSGDVAADTTSGATDGKSELSPPRQEAQVRRICDCMLESNIGLTTLLIE